IGSQTALKLIRQHGSIENILENINKERYQIPDDWPYEEARRLFKEPLVFADDEQLEIKWSAPDEEVLESNSKLPSSPSFGFLTVLSICFVSRG
ncbi:Elongation of fatty acids protein 2, partial [Sarracenia purpurea var. burkii]